MILSVIDELNEIIDRYLYLYEFVLLIFMKLHLQEGPTTITPTEPVATGPALACAAVAFLPPIHGHAGSSPQLTWASTLIPLLISTCTLP